MTMSGSRRETVEWRDWMEELDFLQSPHPVWARPEGLGSLGEEAYFVEPYRIRSPRRVHVGAAAGIGPRSNLAVGVGMDSPEGDPVLRIGEGAVISTDFIVASAGSVEIGVKVGISARVFIGGDAEGFENPDLVDAELPIVEPRTVRIGDGALVGTGAFILPGVTIGERALVAARAVVTRDVPPRSVVFGHPARIVRHWDEAAGAWSMGPPRLRVQ